MTPTEQQLKNLKLGAGYWYRNATPEQRKQFVTAGGKAQFAKYGSAEMSRRAKLSNQSTPAQLEQARALGKRNVESGWLEKIKTREGSIRGALKACHIRWHVLRCKPNPKKCELCRNEGMLAVPAKGN